LEATVANDTANPASNWQVAINLNQSTINQGVSGAELNVIGGVPIFSPNQNSPQLLQPGSSATFTFSVNKAGSNYMPTIATVNGVANGTSGAGIPASGVDTIAQAVATGALNIAIDYENNKPGNNGDPNYAQYDNLIWSSQSFVISGSTIAFDPNAPGYAFVPNQAKADLGFMQMDPGVAAYLVDGLQSCFNDSSGIRSGRVWKRRLQRIRTSAHVGVIGIDPRCMNANQHLTG